jgi:amino acid adenylation domain-containing protein
MAVQSIRVFSWVELLRLRAREEPQPPIYTFLVNGEEESDRLTSRELDRRARAIGALLQENGGRGERALLLYPPGLDFIAAFFGALYGGAVAVPAYPPRVGRGQPRLRSIARDAAPRVVLTTSALAAQAEALLQEIPELGSAVWLATDALPAGLEERWRDPEANSETTAFLQYTSGSTADPKGVMVSHGNLLHNQEMIRRAFGQSRDSVIVGWLPLYHDMGLIGNVMQPLYVGGRCVLMSPMAFLQRPLRWLEAVSRYRGTTSGGPNFAYELCVRKAAAREVGALDLSSWTLAFNGAEPVRAETLERFAAAFTPYGFDRRALYPCYGLAEATLFVSGGVAGRDPVTATVEAAALEKGLAAPAAGGTGRELVGCGGAWLEQEIRIADPETGEPCAPGRVGEVQVAGPSIAQGYWNRPEETAGTFVRQPDGGRLLRTGDLGFLQGTELFITGRLKDLVILRGRNLYPQDVELSAERSHPALRPGCGAAFAADAGGEERLVVVFEVERGGEARAGEIAAAVRQAVAEEHDAQVYDLVLLPPGAVPKTSSGKIQRRACRARYLASELPAVARSGTALNPHLPALSPLSPPPPAGRGGGKREEEEFSLDSLETWLRERLARGFGLPVSAVVPDQPLTSLGLDSLAAVELQHALRSELGADVGVTELLEGPTVRELASRLAERRGVAETSPSSIHGGSPNGELPLSYGQRALWFLQRLQPEGSAYNIAAAVRVTSPLDVETLRRAWELLAVRHEALRAAFPEGAEGEPVQRIQAEGGPGFAVEPAEDWSEERLRHRLQQEAHRPFDLGADPLLRVAVFHLGAGEHAVLLAVHHIVADLWSLAVLARELGIVYSALGRGEEARLAPLPLAYPQAVARQLQAVDGEAGERLWGYWRERLAGELPVSELPADRPRPAAQSFRGGARRLRLDPGLAERLRGVGHGRRATLFATLLAGFQALLHRYSGQTDLIAGSPTAGRETPDLAGLVGYFVNPVALRTDLSGDPSFAALLDRVRETVLGAFRHQAFPFPFLVERLQPRRDPSRSPVFQVMFVLQRVHLPEMRDLSVFALGQEGVRVDLGDLAVESMALEQRAAQLDLELMAAETGRGLVLTLVYDADLFDASTVDRTLGHLAVLLRGAAEDPETRLAGLPLLTAEEQGQLAAWNRTDAELPGGEGACFPALFEIQVARAPGAVAAEHGAASWTYAELNDRADRLARALVDVGEAGGGPEAPVAVWADRGLDFLAAVVGILKAGRAYLPLDPRQPAPRLLRMLEQGRCRLVLAGEEHLDACRAAMAGLPGLSVLPLRSAMRGPVGPVAGPSPDRLAYILFTSGSTGQPKGAMIEHHGMLNHLYAKVWDLGLGEADRVAQTAAPTFDISVWQFLAALLVGGRVCILDDGVVADPGRLLREVEDRGVTVLEVVPSLLRALLDEADRPPLPALRWLIPTGEALPPDLCAAWFAVYPGIRLVNAYGPTECSDDVTHHVLAGPLPADALRTPVGRPVANLRLYVVDRLLAPLPAGVPGELCVAGAGVGRGYVGDPGRTAEVFVPDPFSPEPGPRLYRTGDLGLYRPDGTLEVLGRSDHQVKVRGFRIELGEIEAALAAHPAVREAVLRAWYDPRGEARLAAYWTASAEAAVSEMELREHLRRRLPEAMVPAAFVPLEALPLTANGKVDRKALPEPGWAGEARPEAPRDEVEALVAGAFAEVLGREGIGPGDSFFDAGGHSLLATQVLSRLRRTLGVELPLRTFFEEPTAAGLAARVRALRGEAAALPPLVRGPREPAAPLSFAQRRLWFLSRLEPESPEYNMPGEVRLEGELSVPALAASLNGVVRRHEALRTVFRSQDEEPWQEVLPSLEIPLPEIDLSALPPAARELHARELAGEESRRPFDLAAGPLLRAALVHLGGREHRLLLTLHHIVSDGWSQGVLVREVSALYRALAAGEVPDLPEPPVQYADFARWQRDWLRDGVLETQLAWWRRALGETHPVLELPLDRPRPPRRTHRGGRREVRIAAAPPAPAAALRRLVRGEGATPFMGLLALFQALLHRYGGQAPEIRVGTPVANRRWEEIEGLIGFFVNTLVLRAGFTSETSLRALLPEVRETALGAFAHQDVPFERLVEELQPERDLSRTPLFQAMFVLQNAPAPRLDLPGLSLAVSEVDNGTAKFELTLSLEETGDGLLGWIEYNSDLFDIPTVERFAASFGRLLEAAVADPDRPLAGLPLLGEAGRLQLLAEWNDTRAEIPGEALVHRLVETQAERAPDAVAVSGGGLDLTYGELRRRALRLAGALRAAGVGPDVPVGIFAERSCETVVGLLAVLEAGGAYLPLDPLYPVERLASMLEDSRTAVVLAQERLVASLPERELRVVPLGAGPVEEDRAGRPLVPPRPENLAYILFTSGSTGRPKGVQVPHRALVNLLASLARPPLALGGKTLLSVTTLSFDIAGVEVFLPLATGGRVVLAGRETVLDGARLAALAESVQADFLQATPATWRLLAEAGWSGKADLAAVTTGEAVPRELAEWVRARVPVLWNLYGPTETTVFSSFHRVDGPGAVPIGRPVANTALHVLDRALAPVPLGVPGEFYIGGEGLARGYAGRPDLTAERFVPDPVGGEPGGRLYRSGDLCRHLPDGRLEYLGRGDHQVKLRGFRIELAEIEAVLEAHPAVEQSVVVSDGQRLTAFFVASGAPGADELRATLARRLPDYMVPSSYVRLDAMPLTANGKVDRRALPALAPERAGTRPFTAPRNPAEEVLAGIFAQVLDLERVGVDDPFFELGGHSLLATRVVSRANAAFGVDLPLRGLFEAPTVAGLARLVAASSERRARPRPPLRRIPRDRPPLASLAQERLWVMEQLAPGNPVYNVFQALRITGPLDEATLERGLAEVVRRHEALRTRITTLQGRPVQGIDPEPRLSLARIDLSGLSRETREREASRLARAEARRPFRLAHEPLVRGSLLLLGEGERVLLLAMHHIVCDDWSIGLLVGEVGALYGAFRRGLPSPLPELPCQYADYAQWQREWLDEVLEEELEPWRRRLGVDPPRLDLPADRPRPARQSFQGAVEPFSLPAPLAAALRRLGRQEGATLFMTLLAGFAAVLGQAAGQEDLVVGTPVAGRNRPEIEPLIGFFVNLLPLRLDLSGRPAYRELLARVRDVALDAYGHQDVPFEKLVEVFRPQRDPSRPALHQVALSVQETSMRPIALGEGLEIQPLATDPGVSRLDLTLFVGTSGEDLAGYCEYDTALFDRATVVRLLDSLRLVLEDMAADPGRPLLAPKPPVERAAVPDTLATNLTPGQLLFWFAPRLQPGVQLYFDRATTTFTVDGELDAGHFARAFRALVDGCDTLRTRIVERGGMPWRVAGAAPADPLEVVDLAGDADFAAWLAERAARPFDLGERMYDSVLVRLGPGRSVWFFNVHHIAADAGSLQTLARHLSELYGLSREGRLDEARPLPSFEEYAAEEIRYPGSESYLKSQAYWERKLALPAGTNTFYRRSGAPFTTHTERLSFDLGREASDRVRALAARGGLFSPAVVFLGALFALLHRVHGDSRLRIGTSFSNRPHRFRDVVGLMMNTCPLQIEVGDGETFRSLLRRVQGEMIETSRHQRYPVRNPVEDRAYNVYINYQAQSYTGLCGLPVRFDLFSSDHSNDHLNVQVSDFTVSGSFRIDLDFNLTAFAGPERARTLGHFQNLLAALLDDPDGRLSDAPMLSPDELRQIAVWNEAAAEALPGSFSELFAAQVARTPEAPAASCGGERLTYRQLDERAGRMARALHAAGCGPEVPVAVLGERGLDFLAAVLACLRVGGVYLPLDPHHPPQRLAQVLEASGAARVLVSERSRRLLDEVIALLPERRRPEVLPLAGPPAPAASSASPLPPMPRPEGIAYVLFTSGSTGVPKGVMVEWPGVLNHLRAKIDGLGLTAADVVAQNASQCFDISIWQLLAALLAGGRVHIVEDETALDAAKLLRETAAEGITVLEIVPSLLAVLLDTATRRPGGAPELPRLRWLVPTGEALPAELCRRWFALYPRVPLLNAYGPTECSDDVTHHPMFDPSSVEAGITPIGRALPNVRLYVVDRQLALAPAGIPGELCVGGVCVGRGYLREPGRTADAFRPDGLSGGPGERLYRTGDLARFLEDGTLEFLGRIDHQVKVRGFRIELGEIESVLMGFPGVREAVLLAREDHAADRRLVAYYVPEPGWGPTAAQLRGYLQSKLPDYMVPSAFVALEAMPLTPNGKVDRRALPPPDAAQEAARPERTAPRSPLESLIAGICSQVLRVEPIGVHDNFFELGGNSLLATQVITLVQEVLPVEIDLRSLFEGPTVAGLAQAIDSRGGEMGEQERALMAEILADYEQIMSAGSA